MFEGGFLGLDNIGLFDRSAPLPTGGTLEQADGTSWMAMFCLDMLTIAVELALDNPVYEDGWTGIVTWLLISAALLDPRQVVEKGFDAAALTRLVDVRHAIPNP